MAAAGPLPSFSSGPEGFGGGGSFADDRVYVRGPIATGVVPLVPGLPEWSKGLNDTVNSVIDRTLNQWIWGR